MIQEEIKYPAPFLAHWATGPVPCCEKHRYEIVRLGAFMGYVVAITENSDESLECTNCKNETT
jgi:hypothetical protein